LRPRKKSRREWQALRSTGAGAQLARYDFWGSGGLHLVPG
jgi:hypothetical protein